MDVNNCPACGKPYPPAASYCTSCGQPLLPQQDEPVDQPAASRPPASFSQLPGVEMQPTRKKQSRLVWILTGAACLCLCGAAILAGFVMVPRLLETGQPVTAVVEPDRPPESSPTPMPVDPVDLPGTVPEPAITQPVSSSTPIDTIEPSPTPSPTPTPRPEGHPFVGQLAPEFTLLDAITGEAITLSHFTGQPVMINFWATWCIYCEDEMPLLQAAFDKRHAEGLVILAIDYKDTHTDVVEYGQANNLTFHLLLDTSGEITDKEYLVTGFPTSFFIFPDGTIAFIQLGTMTHEELDQQLENIMSP